ncbi:MAG TPA: lipase maturation factor family protein [Chthoniobacterales bacterium]|nr:lipase maturation factor family protein [Chthoniobacterales bacterium]
MLFDGDCHFCRRWIERWRDITAGEVDYAPFQEAVEQFPEIRREDCERAVQFVEKNGRLSSGAEAVFRSLTYGRGPKWLARCYERVPGFAPVTDAAYSLVARNRMAASMGTRLLWGKDVRRPTYFTARRIFVRALALIFLIAFISLWTQVDGLIGERGVSPIARFLPAAREQIGPSAPYILPTLCWLNASNEFLHVLCGAGVALSLLLIAGLLPAITLMLLFVGYLSLTVAGQTFLSFQWDILLLETGFLAIFFAPWRWRLNAARGAPVSSAGLFLLKLLLFKLMFMSGVVKLTSGDESWWDLSAMTYHYETQPLPTVLGWWAHQAPLWLQKSSTAFTLFAELAVPCLIWAPRRLRLLGAALLIGLQAMIGLTGNYAFFNLLTIVLCLLLIDDAAWRQIGAFVRRKATQPASPAIGTARVQRAAAATVLAATLPLNAMLIYSAFKPEAMPPRPLVGYQDALEPFRIVNGYGLFRVMTKTRPEIVIEGSADGVDWLPYAFKWKAGDVQNAPRRVAPHQPRLDWQMWFAALGSYRQNRWFLGLCERLFENSPEVVALLERNPFPDAPPRYIRGIVYDYEFTTPAERRETGAWWKRRELREYVSLQRRDS